MKLIRMFAGLALLLFAVVAFAQQNAPANSEQPSLPSVDDQMKVLTQKLDLTADQQTKIRPIMQRLHDITEKLMQDENLTRDERLARVRPERVKAGDEIRTFLSDEQKEKFAEYLKGPHREMHGNLSGGASPQPK